MIDIIYSYTVHEALDAFEDTLNNLYYFNKSYKIAVIIHTIPSLYDRLIEVAKKYDSVYINSACYIKERHVLSALIVKAHTENYFYITSIIDKFNNFILMASNCYFHKQLDLSDQHLITILPDYRISDPDGKSWFWPQILKNKIINDMLKEEIGDFLTCTHHEGLIIESGNCKRFFSFINNNKICDKFVYPQSLEEYLIPSLIMGYEKRVLSICKIFWAKPNFTPSIEDISTCNLPCVKRVSRVINDPIRVWMRDQTNNYQKI